MSIVDKIDSNSTGLHICVEDSFKTVSGDEVWNQFEPNEYADFGPEYTTTPRSPIRPDRQRRKGPITDQEVPAGFQMDLQYGSFFNIINHYMMAAYRSKGIESVTAVDIDGANPDEYEVASTTGFLVGSLVLGRNFTNPGNNTMNAVTAVVTDTSVEVATGTLTAEASPPSDADIVVVGYQFGSGELDVDVTTGVLPRLNRASGSLDFTTLGLAAGEWIYVGGDAANTSFATAQNGYMRVRSVAATYIEIDKAPAALVADAGSGKTIQIFFGNFLKNEQQALFVHNFLQIERALGAPESTQPTQIQYEYLTGQTASELKINLAGQDKITLDCSFMGADHEPVAHTASRKGGTFNSASTDDAFNTTSDVASITVAQAQSDSEYIAPLFGYVQEMSITLNNNVTLNKAIGSLGGFDATAGEFMVSAEIKAYFKTVQILTDRKNNIDVTLDAHLMKDNKGITIDMPLIGMASGIPEVEANEPIFLPLNVDAVSGEDVDAAQNHTLSFTLFDWLPNAANS